MKFVEIIEPATKVALIDKYKKDIGVRAVFEPEVRNGYFAGFQAEDGDKATVIGQLLVVCQVAPEDAQLIAEGDSKVMDNYLWMKGRSSMVSKDRELNPAAPALWISQGINREDFIREQGGEVDIAKELVPIAVDLSDISSRSTLATPEHN